MVTDNMLADLREFGMRSQIPRTLNLQGQALSGLGRKEAARDRWLEACTVAEAIGARRILWEVLLAISRLEPDPTGAERLGRQAQKIVECFASHTAIHLRGSFLAQADVCVILVGIGNINGAC